jgi:hypothetical protein
MEETMRNPFVMVLFAAAMYGQPIFTTFDAPGAGTGEHQGTFAVSMNGGGTITGTSLGATQTGFVRDPDGTMTSFNPPNATYTTPTSINDSGVITGYYNNAGVTTSFVRSSDGTITSFTVPNESITEALSINSTGVVVGWDQSGLGHGFMRAVDGSITSIDVAGAQSTYATAINDAGLIAGDYTDVNNVFHGFVLFTDGTITTFDAPGAGSGYGQGTFPNGINNGSAVTGCDSDSAGKAHGFVSIGFNLRTSFPWSSDGPVTSFVVAGAVATNPYSINDHADVVGDFKSATGVFGGFLWYSPGYIETASAPGAGTLSGQGTFPMSINYARSIAGYYIDSSGVAHGFVGSR